MSDGRRLLFLFLLFVSMGIALLPNTSFPVRTWAITLAAVGYAGLKNEKEYS